MLSPDEWENAQTLSASGLKTAQFPPVPAPLKPIRAQADASRTAAGLPDPDQARAQKLTGVARILTQYVAEPLWDHPILSLGAATLPPVALYYSGVMAKDITEYAAQKTAELTLNAQERALAEADPNRIPGERAAVEAVSLAAGPVIHSALKNRKAGEMPVIEGGPRPATTPAESQAAATAAGLEPAQPELNTPAGQDALAQRLLKNKTFDPTQEGGSQFVTDPRKQVTDLLQKPSQERAQSIVKQHVADVVDSWKKVFAPASRGEQAGEAASILRASTGEMAQTYEQAAFKLDEFRRAVEPLPEVDKLGFIDAIEGGRSQASPEFQEAANTMRETLDTMRDKIRALGTGKLDNFIENYFPHIWTDPERATDAFKTETQQTFGKRPMEGSKSFLKERTIPTTLEGIQKGLTPVTTNPVDLTLLKLREMQRYYLAHTSLQEMKAQDLLKYVRVGDQIPDGYQRINDKIATVYGPREGAVSLPDQANIKPEDVSVYGRRIMGEYWAPEPVARIVNNYLSPGLRGNALYDAYRGLGNTLNMFQLGFSAFHLGFTSMDASVSRVALGLEYVKGGSPIRGLRTVLSAPFAPVTNLRLGARIRSAYLDPASATPDMQALANAVKEAGGRVRMDSFYRNSAPQKLAEAWKNQEYFKAVGYTLPAITEMATKPLMEYIVPMQKLGVFGDLSKKILDSLPPDATLADRRSALQDAWDSVDNRMGQLVYDNLFWSKSFKDMAMGSVRSVGWNIGTIRELGGGLTDLAKQSTNLTRGEKLELSHRAAYVIALPMTVGFYGALYQYLRTGQGPQEMKDYFFPKTGEVDADGNPERVQMASYMKDMFAYSGHPWDTIKHKMNPILSSVYEMLQNEDYYGDQIRNPDDPFVQQIAQEAGYIAKTIEPFSLRNVQEQSKRGDRSNVTKLGSWFGITPAPREEIRSDAQNRIAMYLNQSRESGATPEQVEQRQARADILRGLRGDENVNLTRAVSKAIETEQLTPNDVVRLLRRAGLTPMQEKFKSLTLEQAVDVFKRANPREKAQFAEALLAKVDRATQVAASQ
jgi:hypothetical protein